MYSLGDIKILKLNYNNEDNEDNNETQKSWFFTLVSK